MDFCSAVGRHLATTIFSSVKGRHFEKSSAHSYRCFVFWNARYHLLLFHVIPGLSIGYRRGKKMKLLCWMDENFHFTFRLCTIASLWSNSFHEWSFIHLVYFIVNSYLRLCFIHVCLILLFQQASYFSFVFSHFSSSFLFHPAFLFPPHTFPFSFHPSFYFFLSLGLWQPFPFWVSFVFPFHLWSRSCVFKNQLELSNNIIEEPRDNWRVNSCQGTLKRRTM